MADAPARRSGFAPTVLAGLATAGLTAVTSARPWFRVDRDRLGTVGVADSELRADMPLALALALVVLAAWGVVLVSRGRVRRAVLGLGLVADLGVVACAVRAPATLPDQIRRALVDGAGVPVDPTAAYVVACVGVVLSVVALAVGWRLAPRWPTMSSRYDAPATQAAEASDTDLWKALDAGQDPTDPNRSAGPPSP